MNEVPIWEKIALTVEEAAQYSNIGVNKIRQLLNEPGCDFVLYVGSKRLVKKRQFERFVSEAFSI